MNCEAEIIPILSKKISQSQDIVSKISELGKSLTYEQKLTLLAIFDECKKLGATSENLAPLATLIFFDWSGKVSDKAMAWAKEEIKKHKERTEDKCESIKQD